MARSLGDIRLFVRTSIDLEVEELPDALVDVFVAEGARKCYDAIASGTYYEKEYTLPTAAGTQAYAFTDIGDGDLNEVASIQGPHWVLEFVDHNYAKTVWTPDLLTEQEPYAYSFFGGSLFLWPTPGDVYSLSITGKRKMTDWMAGGAGALPDIPESGHDLVAQWALSQTYAQQDDPQLGEFFAQAFAAGLAEFKARELRAPTPQPLVLNRRKGGGITPPYLRYPFPISGS